VLVAEAGHLKSGQQLQVTILAAKVEMVPHQPYLELLLVMLAAVVGQVLALQAEVAHLGTPVLVV
jgi:hypothetical protein